MRGEGRKECSGLPSGQPAQPVMQASSPAAPMIFTLPRKVAAGRQYYGFGLAAPFCPILATVTQAPNPYAHATIFFCCFFPLQLLPASSKFSFIFNLQFRVSPLPGSLLRFAPIRSVSFFPLLSLFLQHSIDFKIRLHCRQDSWYLFLSTHNT